MNMKEKFRVKEDSSWVKVEEGVLPVNSDRIPCLVVLNGALGAAFLQDGKFNKEGVSHFILPPKELPNE